MWEWEITEMYSEVRKVYNDFTKYQKGESEEIQGIKEDIYDLVCWVFDIKNEYEVFIKTDFQSKIEVM